MSSIINMRTSVATVLVLFGFLFSGILLFGFMNTLFNNNILILFKTLYFVIGIVILGIVYLTNRESFKGVLENILIILAILIVSAGVATLASALKSNYDVNQYIFESGSIEQLEAQKNQYAQYADSMKSQIDILKSGNLLLEEQIVSLTEKINNRTPIINETIVTLPPETIYEEEPVLMSPREDEYEEEGEEDE